MSEEKDAPETEEKPKKESKPASKAATDAVRLGKKFEIYPDQPLPQYNQGEIKAYKATNKAEEDLFALLCVKGLTPRTQSIPVYVTILNPLLAHLIGQGVTFWPLTNQQHFILIYKDTLGDPLQKEGEKAALGWKQDMVLGDFIQDFAAAVEDLHRKDFFHGAIRATNLFDGGKAPGGGRCFGGLFVCSAVFFTASFI